MLEKTVSGKIADAIARLAQDTMQELYPEDGKGTVDLYWEMITGNPVIGAAVEAKVLFGIRQIGEFQHENPKVQDFIHHNFSQMDGSIKLSVAELYSALPIGWGFSEIAIREPQDSSYLLESLMLVDHRYHTFEGRKGQIENVIYRPPGGVEKDIPYSKGIHVVNKPHLARREPYGIADCKAAVAAWKAWKIVINEMLIAGQRQATPILVGKAPKDGFVELLDRNGVPLRRDDGSPAEIKATHALVEKMSKLEKNGGVISVDLDHEIQALQQQTDGQFFMLMLVYLEKLMLRAFLVPETMFSVGEGGLGNAGIAQEHRESFELHLKAIAVQIKEQLIECLIRPLILWEFGEQENYGGFVEPPHDDEDALDLLGKLTQAFQSGVYSTADVDAINRHRELAGIPPIEEVVSSINNRVPTYREIMSNGHASH